MPEDEKNEIEEQVEKVSPNGEAKSALSRLLTKETLIPAAAAAATAAAAGLAAKKGPDLKNRITGEAKEGAEDLGGKAAEGAKERITGGGLGSVVSGASKLLPGVGGGGKGSKKKTRRLPIQRWTDVAVPVNVAYEKWTSFEDFPKFMHRVLDVQQEDDSTVKWEEKIWFSKRQWKGKITDNRKNDRIAWTTESGTSHTGIVSFHKLDANLTRVLVTVDFQPAGMIEKMASGLRFVKRAVQSDLARFKAYVELGEAEGVEYEVAPSNDDRQEKDEQGKDDQKAQQDETSESDDDADRESEREQREERRRERRETATSA